MRPTLEMKEHDMDGETNTVQPERDSGPGRLDVLEAQITLQLASAHARVQDLQLHLQRITEENRHPRNLPRDLRELANQLEDALRIIWTLEPLRLDGQL